MVRQGAGSCFSGDGQVITPMATDGHSCNSLILRSKGRVLAGGYVFEGSNQIMGLAAYRENGLPDTSISGGGKQILDFGGADNVSALALQQDGRILVAGAAGTKKFALVRLKSDGTVNSTFGTSGVASAPLNGHGGYAYDLVVQSTGRIVVVGNGHDGSQDFAAARFLP